jgi:uncharacterized protein with HEPN domain
MSSPRDDLVYIEDMLGRARRVIARTESVTWERFRDDLDLHDIAERGVSILGEAACKVSSDFRSAHPEIPWAEVMGIRHKIVHDYFEVSYTVLWSVIREELPSLEAALAALLDDEAPSD